MCIKWNLDFKLLRSRWCRNETKWESTSRITHDTRCNEVYHFGYIPRNDCLDFNSNPNIKKDLTIFHSTDYEG